MTYVLGRRLKKGEVVHHKNGKKTDNRICNLEMLSNAEHTTHHNIGKDRSKIKKKCLYCDKPMKARKLCNKHYAQWLRHGDCIVADRKVGIKKCLECGKEGKTSRGYCSKHYQRLRKQGFFDLTKEIEKVKQERVHDPKDLLDLSRKIGKQPILFVNK